MDDPGFGSEPVLYSCNAAAVRKTAGGSPDVLEYFCEAAGASFSAKFEARTRGPKEILTSAEDSDSDTVEDYGGRDRRSPGSKGKPSPNGALKMSELIRNLNLYELLGVSEGASQDEIKKSYRALALSAHPDKQATMDPGEAKKVQERFVQIQEAYELLSDKDKRIQYDTLLDFDDGLPKFKPGQDFFEVFGEVFRRNARFSTRRPVPDLGAQEAKPEEVKKFYDFWRGFQSWRDPLVLAQQDGQEILDLAEAECREEKRWMVRENERVAKVYRQAERDRISELVKMAEKYDPRILAAKEAQKAAKQAESDRKEQEKLAVQRAKEEAERAKQEAEAAAKAVEDARKREEKAAREAVKALVKKQRQRLRSFHPNVKDHVVIEQLNEVCLQFEEPALRELSDSIDDVFKKGGAEAVAAAVALMHQAIKSIGLTPLQVVKNDDDAASTSSGPSHSSNSAEDPQILEEQRRKEEERLKKQQILEAKKAEEEAKKAEERARLAVEKAEERKKKEETKKKEQAAAEAKKRQQEKKEEDKARKAEERAKLQEEQEQVRRQQQREEAKQRSLEQAERDKAAAQALKEEQELERITQLFSKDRMERLAQLDPLTEENLATMLKDAAENDPCLRGALRLVKEHAETGNDVSTDRAMGIVSKLGTVWPLGLNPPAEYKLESALRNRVKKARLRLRDVVAAFMRQSFADADTSAVAAWQRDIASGDLAPPVWTPEDRENELREKEAREAAAKAAATASTEAADGTKSPQSGGKKKKVKEPKAEEDLDAVLQELGITPQAAAKGGKKKK